MRLALRGLGAGFGTLAIYLGLSLFGWGLSALPSFFQSCPRAAYSFGVALFALAVGCQAVVAPEGIHGSKGQAEKRVRRQTVLGVVLVGLLFGGLVLLPFADRRGIAVYETIPALQWVGVAAAGAGYALIFLSGWFLGRQYSAEVTIQEGHQLITTGPYRYVRHPRYLGVILVTLGISLLFRSWLGLALLPIVVGLLWLRIEDEETLMQAELGAPWEEYCRHTNRLLPAVGTRRKVAP